MNPKYHLLATAAALSLGACSTDNTGTDPVPEPLKEGYKISFTVVEDSESRTTLDAGDKLRWVYTDKVGIYTVGQTPDSNTNSNALTIADVNQSPVEFIGVLPNYVTKGDMFYAYYPYDAEQSTNPAAVTLSIPAEQTQTVAGVYNGLSNPLVALPTPIEWEQNSYAGRICSARFRQLGAIVELQLHSTDEKILEEKIRSVTFESENTPLAGDFTFDLTGVTVKEELPIEGYESTKVKTTLDQPAAIPATKEEAARVYLTIAPGTYSGKIIVETSAGQYVFLLTKEMTFERAMITGLPAEISKANQFINFADDNVKEICLLSWDKNKDGELSRKEAAEVTVLYPVFAENEEIVSFNEFQYFTGLETIGENAFAACESLTSITIPEGVTEIGSRAFEMCSSLTGIELPNGVMKIKDNAFASCERLTSINIPDGVTEIDVNTFYGCSSLTSIELPNGLKTIGNNAFRDCSSLTSITIPKEVTGIRSFAFDGCSKLTSVYCKPTTPPTLTSCEFPRNSSLKIYVPAGSVEAYKTAPSWVSYITKIFADPNDPISFADPKAKELCVKNWDTNKDGELSYKEAAAVEALGRVFNWNSTITSFDELQYFTGLRSIEENAFWGCTSLTSIHIPEGVTKIGKNAFFNCPQLTSIKLPNGVTAIGENAFDSCKTLTSINIPNEVTEIGKNAFYFCENLTSINIPKGVTEIGAGVFSNCSSLTNIDIPDGVTAIGTLAFFNCSSLRVSIFLRE